MNDFLDKYIKYKNKYIKLKTEYDELLMKFKQNAGSYNIMQDTESDNIINENMFDKIMFDQAPIQNAGGDNIIYIGKDAESNNIIQSTKEEKDTEFNNIIQNAGSNNIIQSTKEEKDIIEEQSGGQATFNDVFINNKITNKRYNNINARLFLNYQDELITENSELSIFNST